MPHMQQDGGGGEGEIRLSDTTDFAAGEVELRFGK